MSYPICEIYGAEQFVVWLVQIVCGFEVKANALSRLSCNLPDVTSIGSVTQRLSALAESNALIVDNERIFRMMDQMN